MDPSRQVPSDDRHQIGTQSRADGPNEYDSQKPETRGLYNHDVNVEASFQQLIATNNLLRILSYQQHQNGNVSLNCFFFARHGLSILRAEFHSYRMLNLRPSSLLTAPKPPITHKAKRRALGLSVYLPQAQFQWWHGLNLLSHPTSPPRPGGPREPS